QAADTGELSGAEHGSTSGFGAVDWKSGQPADSASGGKPHVAAAFWRGAGAVGGGFRRQRAASDPSRAGGLAGGGIDGATLEHERAASADGDEQHLSHGLDAGSGKCAAR